MNSLTKSWTRLQRDEGSDFLKWLEDNQILSRKFKLIEDSLWTLLHREVQTEEDALNVWRVTPAVISCCDDPGTYNLPQAPVAYAWLYLLDRYVRTWMALRLLIEANCASMGKNGVNALDVGTGPGPSAFATHDFYSSMVEYAEQRNSQWNQPAYLTGVELNVSTNQLRSHLAEIMFVESHGESGRLLAMCNALGDFGAIKPREDRKSLLRYFLSIEDTYFDETVGEWTSDPVYLPDEANDMAQVLHRYRLITFSNFLTSKKTVKEFQSVISDILQDCSAGTLLLVIGGVTGRDSPYKKVHKRVNKIARRAGFSHLVSSGKVSYAKSEVADHIYQAEKRFYEYLWGLAPYMHEQVQEVREHEWIRTHFEKERQQPPISEVNAYRKI